MLNELLFLLAQVDEVPDPERPSLLFNARNGILLLVLIAIIVGYKIYKNKTMS